MIAPHCRSVLTRTVALDIKHSVLGWLEDINCNFNNTTYRHLSAADYNYSMAEVERSARHTRLLARRRRDDLVVAVTALVGSMLALPLATSSWNGPEVAATLAVAATCMLAGQRWAIALVAFSELLLVPTLAVGAFSGGLELFPGRIVAFAALLMLVPGLVQMRRASAALVLLAGIPRTQHRVRRVHAAVIALGAVVIALPFI